jgi:phosphoserine phosphatase RsbU/P
MGIFTLVLVALWGMRILLITPRVRFSFPLLGLSVDLLSVFLVIPVIYYSWKLLQYVRSRTFWKISRRLMLANVFIGAIPILFVIAIFYSSALLFYYQLSYFLISNQIGIHEARIHDFNMSLRDGLQQLMTRSSHLTPDALNKAIDADAKYLLATYPSASIILNYRDPDTKGDASYAVQTSLQNRKPAPDWLGNRFSGLIVEDDQEEGNRSNLYLRSYVYSDFRVDSPFSIEVSVPIDHHLLGRLRTALGQNMLLAKHAEHTGLTWMFPNTDIPQENILDSTFESEGKNTPSAPMWPVDLFPVLWSTGKEPSSAKNEISSANTDVLMIEVSLSKLLHNLFHSESRVGTQIYGVLKIAVILFLLVEIVSIVIGIALTRSITNAVYNLDRGTEFVKKGDFSQRIVVKSNDQLGALAASFNQMTEFIQQLVKERVQKERMDRELEIAKEVQERLFPNHAPRIGRLDVAGICLPARTVSGDYYDYLLLGKQQLGLALGDICGKGISAALLMATLQATLRSNVLNLWSNDGSDGEKMVAKVVERLNGQIYDFTTANKFASFFYALYDDARQTLTYCNAGHNPPLYLNGNEVKRLNVGGTLVGIFADSKYDQETIKLSPGDLLVAYTDGIVESVNEHGEEFGEHRLIQAVQENRNLSADRIKKLIVERVLSWAYAEEREDDMTLIVARIDKQIEAPVLQP